MRRYVLRVALVALLTGWAVSVRADDAVYFGTGSSKVTSDGASSIRQMVKKSGSGASYKLTGFTDPRGSDDVNQRLREARVEAVKKLLLAAGVAEAQIQTSAEQTSDAPDISKFWRLRKVSISVEGGATATAEPETKPTTAEPASTTKPANSETKAETKTSETKVAETKPEVKRGPDGKPLEPIRLIYWKAFNHALWILAKDEGFFEAEGFDAKLQETDDDARVLAKQVIGDVSKGASGAQSTHALEAGQKKFFAGAICGYATHEAMARGEPVVDIGSMIMVPETRIMSKELAQAVEKDIRAFKGKKIGSMSAGAGLHDFTYDNLLRAEFQRVGLKDGDYQLVPYDSFEKEYADLLAKKIDVASGFPPGDVEFTRSHPDYTRVPLARFFPFTPCCRQLVTRTQLKENRDKYVRLLRASIRAHEFSVLHPNEAISVLSKELKTPPDVVREAIMTAYVSLMPDPMKKGVELYQRSNASFTNVHKSTAEYIDTSLYRDALLSLAKESQNDPAKKKYYDGMIARFKQNN